MRRLGTLLAGIVALAIVVLIGYAVVHGAIEDPSLVGSLAVAAAAVIAVVWGNQREKQLDLLQTHKERMSPIYEQVFDAFRDPPDRTPEATKFWKDLHRQLTLFASTPVVEAWLVFQRAPEPEGDGPNIEYMLLWERVLLAVRADLGHNNKSLKPGDLLRIHINDLDEYLTS